MTPRPILCVDDESSNLAVLRQILHQEYPLAFAKSGVEALRAAAKHSPALILLDVDLPDIDGYEVARQLKREPVSAPIPIIFVTAKNKETDQDVGFEAGGVDYITKPFSPCVLRARVRTHLSLVASSTLASAYRDAIRMLAVAGHYSDNVTGSHIWRMSAYARALAEAAGWPEEEARLLEDAAPMHDTGKIGIPDAVLKKPGPLTAEEWEVMKQHPRIGHDILCHSQAPLFKLAAEIALYHHEHWDGSGYPVGLIGDAIPEAARIVAVADIFDALTSPRPYKEAWSVDQSLFHMDELANKVLDARLVNTFKTILPRIREIKAYWEAHKV